MEKYYYPREEKNMKELAEMIAEQTNITYEEAEQKLATDYYGVRYPLKIWLNEQGIYGFENEIYEIIETLKNTIIINRIRQNSNK